MRQMLLLAALIASQLGIAMAGTVEICSPGSDFSDKYYANYPGNSYVAVGCNIGCNIGYNVGVGFSFYDLEAGTDPVNLFVQGNVAVTAAYVQLQFLDPGPALVAPPIFATIRDNIFQPGAWFKSYYTVPANSVLTFENNTMSMNAAPDDIRIMTFFYAFELTFLQNVTLNIVENTMTVENGDGQAYPIYPSDETSINILRNEIALSGTLAVSYAIFLEATATFGSLSSVNISENEMSLSASSSDKYVLAMYSDYLTGSPNTSLTISGNRINATAEQLLDRPVLQINNISGVMLAVASNIITHNFKTVFSVSTFACLASVSFVDNAIESTQPIESSVIIVNDFQFSAGSTMVVVNNIVSASSVSTSDSMLLFSDTVTGVETAIINQCGNQLPWASTPTVDQLFSSNFVAYVIDDCPTTTTPTSTTTTTPTWSTTTPTSTTTTPTNITDTVAAPTTSITTATNRNHSKFPRKAQEKLVHLDVK